LSNELFGILNATQCNLIGSGPTIGIGCCWPWCDHDGFCLLAIGQCLPQDFGDKRHGWVKQSKYYIQHASQHDLRVTAGYRLPVAWNLRLSNLQVPVAQLIPRKVAEQPIGTRELV